jgi:murein DD-endopeptidase MepM/ murein hydrolase activator NlpD
MAIDGSIYVGRYDGFVRRYFAGVEDPGFQPDTELGLPVSVFLADEPESTLVYVVDGPGRRLLGLERETGLYRLGFVLNFEEVGSLTSAAISAGRLYLTDGQTLYITILTPTPTPAVDCPAFPFSPSIPFDLAALETLELQPPVSASIPVTPSHYPGGRWPQLGYGVLEAVAFAGAPFSDTVRAVVPGTISRIVDDPPPLLDTDMAIITTTGRVPADQLDAMWGKQIWIDHGDGIQTRYGGLAEILPSLAEGQSVRLFTILGYAGEGPLFLGLWADDQYVGYGRSLPLTIVGFRALFGGD